jgi:hypothetical protein
MHLMPAMICVVAITVDWGCLQTAQCSIIATNARFVVVVVAATKSSAQQIAPIFSKHIHVLFCHSTNAS